MSEEEWLTCTVPESMLSAVSDNASIRKCRLLACASCRRIWHLFILKRDQPSRQLVEFVEAVADGRVSELRLLSALEESRARPGKCSDRHFAADRTACLMPDNLGEVMARTASAAGNLASEQIEQSRLLRDVFGNPFRPVTFSQDWRTSTAIALAQQVYDSRDFSTMPILADALQDADCDNADILDHCRGPGPHVRGCWVVDLVLGKE
jgi:hypothetical protein